MTLRNKILLYFVALHVVLAAAAVFVFMENRLMLIGLEVLFALSVILSYRLVVALFIPLDLIRTGAELMSERDFTSHFVKVGQPEMDALIDVYNRMSDELREERLRGEEQHELVGSIMEASPSAIIICDFDGRVQQLNPAAVTLLQRESASIRGKALDDIAHPVGPALAAIPAGTSQLVTYGARRLKCWRTEFRDHGFVKSFFVIDEMTEELRVSEKAAYEKLIRMMSHEVNNTVGALRSLLDSSRNYGVQLAADDRADFENAMTVSSSRLENLNRFMNGFADVVRIPPPDRRPCDLQALIIDVVTLMRPELQDRGIALLFDVTAESTIVALDKNQFEQVLINVIRNAAEAVQRDGRIVASLQVSDGIVTLSVADSGPGIAASDESQLFIPFFTTKRDGRGIGLTVVQEILTSHGYEFTLRNATGGGAELIVVMTE